MAAHNSQKETDKRTEQKAYKHGHIIVLFESQDRHKAALISVSLALS